MYKLYLCYNTNEQKHYCGITKNNIVDRKISKKLDCNFTLIILKSDNIKYLESMRDKLKGDYNYQKKRIYRKSTEQYYNTKQEAARDNGLTMLQLKNLLKEGVEYTWK